MSRYHVAAITAFAVVVGLVPTGTSAQTVVIPPRGMVMDGGRGTAEELQLTVEEAARAFSASVGLIVGVVLPAPEQVPPDFDVEEIVGALRTTVERHGARLELCDSVATGAAACIDGFVADQAAGVVIIGSQGDLVAPTERAVALNLTVPVSIGDTAVAPMSVVIDSDPITRAFEQGRAGGAPKGVPKPRSKGSAIVASAVEPGIADPGTEAGKLGLKETAPRVKILATLGPPGIETTADLMEAVAQLPPSGILIGEGVRLTQATAEGLETLPADLRVVAVGCTPSLMAIIDLGSRIRGCIARSNDGAGEAAGNAILAILIGRDVPGFVDAPLYAYRGTVTIGPGKVQLGRRLPGDNLGVTPEERDAAAVALSGRTVGIVGPWTPEEDEPPDVTAMREAIEAGLGELGATTMLCSHGSRAKVAGRCVADQVAAGVAAIVVLGDKIDLVAPIRAALEAGIPVFGSDAAYLGDTGAVYVDLDQRAVGRLQGRMAGVYASVTWPDNTGAYAAVLNDIGYDGRDPIADAIERSTSLANSNVVPIGRFKTSARSAKAGLVAALKQYRNLKVLLGPNAPRAVTDLRSIKKPKPPRDLVAFARRCTDAIKATIDSDGRIKGCVDVDLEDAGGLVVDAMARVFAGGTVPGLIDVSIAPYPASAATPVGTEIPG